MALTKVTNDMSDAPDPAEILTAIKTVDGTTSGLDADLLDGQEGSYYTAYADTAVAGIVDSSPAALNTLNELAAALGDDASFSTTVTNSIATKAPLASPSFTGAATFAGDIIANKHLRLYTTDDQAQQWYIYTHTDDTLRFNYNGSGADELIFATDGAATFNAGATFGGVIQPSSVNGIDLGANGAEFRSLYLDTSIIASNALSITTGTDLTLDVAGDIILDADSSLTGTLAVAGNVEFPTTQGLSYAGAKNAGLEIGTVASGGSLLVRTPSLNSSFSSGLMVDGSYSSELSQVNLTAAGVHSGGGYEGHLHLRTTSQTAIWPAITAKPNSLQLYTANTERMRILSAGTVRMSKGGTAFAPLAYDGLVIQSHDATGIRIIDAGNGGNNGGHCGIGNDNGNLQLSTAGDMMFDTGFAPTDQLYNGRNERMRIYSAGQVVTPSQPSWGARGLSNANASGGTANANETLVFSGLVNNTGNHYNSSTGIFTAPVAGRYFVTFSGLYNVNDNTTGPAYIMHNSSERYRAYHHNSGGSYEQISASGVVSVAANDTISVYSGIDGWHVGGETSFSGYLIG